MVTIENDENRRRITYMQNNVGIIFEYENNELISKTEIMESNGKILKNGKEEIYKNGIPIRITGYKDGVPHGREIELDLNTRQVTTKLYEDGKDVTSKFSVKDSIKDIGEASVYAIFEEDPKRALQRLMNELVNMIGESKDHKIPNIKIDFKDPELKEGEVVNNYITFYEDGSPKVISEQAFLQDGKLKFRGTYYEHTDDGQLIVSGTYNDNGEKTGVWTKYYENGNLKSKEEYKDGKEQGVHQFYNEKGELQRELEYTDKHTVKKEYLENGSVHIKTYYEDKLKIETNKNNGVLSGAYKEYYENGVLKLETNYIDGKECGISKSYYDNGNLQSEGEFISGKKNKMWYEFYDNKNLKSIIEYENGNISGEVRNFYINGNLKIEGEIKDGKEDGIWKEYNEDGALHKTKTYKEGILKKIEVAKKEKDTKEINKETNNISGYKEVYKRRRNIEIPKITKVVGKDLGEERELVK